MPPYPISSQQMEINMQLTNVFHSFALVTSFCCAAAGCATQRQCPSTGCVADSQITADVQERLDRMPELGAPGSVRVHTIAGVVYLDGHVSAGFAKKQAESVASQEPGVRHVVASIAVSK
jgi:osmotically-inducible protein OsmY